MGGERLTVRSKKFRSVRVCRVQRKRVNRVRGSGEGCEGLRFLSLLVRVSLQHPRLQACVWMRMTLSVRVRRGLAG